MPCTRSTLHLHELQPGCEAKKVTAALLSCYWGSGSPLPPPILASAACLKQPTIKQGPGAAPAAETQPMRADKLGFHLGHDDRQLSTTPSDPHGHARGVLLPLRPGRIARGNF